MPKSYFQGISYATNWTAQKSLPNLSSAHTDKYTSQRETETDRKWERPCLRNAIDYLPKKKNKNACWDYNKPVIIAPIHDSKLLMIL